MPVALAGCPTAARKLALACCRTMYALLVKDPTLRKTSVRQPRELAEMFYPAFLVREMKSAKLVMRCTDAGHFLPAIFCPTARVAAFVAAAFRGLRVCPHCLEVFDPNSERVDGSKSGTYCSVAHGSAYRQKLYRLSLKGKARKTNRRKGKR